MKSRRKNIQKDTVEKPCKWCSWCTQSLKHNSNIILASIALFNFIYESTPAIKREIFQFLWHQARRIHGWKVSWIDRMAERNNWPSVKQHTPNPDHGWTRAKCKHDVKTTFISCQKERNPWINETLYLYLYLLVENRLRVCQLQLWVQRILDFCLFIILDGFGAFMKLFRSDVDQGE